MALLLRKHRLPIGLLAVAAAVVLTVFTFAWAHPAGAQGGPRGNSQQSFVGNPMPDLSVYDASGNPLNLADLKGSTSVLVFGCLT